MAVKNSAPYYDGTGYLQLDDSGNVVLSNSDIMSEILERLNAINGTNIYDNTYGSNLSNLLNTRQTTGTQIYTYVKDALLPMINNGVIQDNIQILPLKYGNMLSVSVSVTSSGGESVTAVYRSLIL